MEILYIFLAVAIGALIYFSIFNIIPFISKIIKKVKTKKISERESKIDEGKNQNIETGSVSEDKVNSKSENLEQIAISEKCVDYEPSIEKETENSNDFKEDEENLEKYLQNIRNNDTILEEISNASPKLKAILLSGVLQDTKFDRRC